MLAVKILVRPDNGHREQLWGLAGRELTRCSGNPGAPPDGDPRVHREKPGAVVDGVHWVPGPAGPSLWAGCSLE